MLNTSHIPQESTQWGVKLGEKREGTFEFCKWEIFFSLSFSHLPLPLSSSLSLLPLSLHLNPSPTFFLRLPSSAHPFSLQYLLHLLRILSIFYLPFSVSFLLRLLRLSMLLVLCACPCLQYWYEFLYLPLFCCGAVRTFSFGGVRCKGIRGGGVLGEDR